MLVPASILLRPHVEVLVGVSGGEERLQAEVDVKVGLLAVLPGGGGEDAASSPDGTSSEGHPLLHLDVSALLLDGVVGEAHAKDEEARVL